LLSTRLRIQSNICLKRKKNVGESHWHKYPMNLVSNSLALGRILDYFFLFNDEEKNYQILLFDELKI